MSILYVVSKNEKHLLLEYKKSNPFLNFDIILDDELRSSFYGVLNNSAITYLKNLGFSYFNAEKIANTTLLLKDLDFEITYKTVDGVQNRINIKDINSHRCIGTLWIFRLFLKFIYLSRAVSIAYTES